MNAFYGETLNDWTSHAAVEKNGNVVAGVNHETKQHGEYEGKPSSEAQTDQINLSSTDTMIDYPMTTDATGYDGNSKGNEKKRPHDDDSSNIMEEKDKSSPPSMKKSNVGSIGGDRIVRMHKKTRMIILYICFCRCCRISLMLLFNVL